jgi:branched-chain amino acid transport system permease protein
VSFYLCLPAAFIVTAIIGVILERLLYRRLYAASHLDQVLFSIGLVFMAISAVDYFMGGQQQMFNLPPELQGRFNFLGIGIGRYRLFIIVICALLAVGLQLALTRTRFGSQLRAAVDDGRVARGLGINTSLIFALTFAFGSGLAGLGGALGGELMGLDPNFPLKFLIYFMIVVTVGGTSSITGPFVAALLLGIADVAGKYYLPALGAFIIYALMVLVLVFRPHGLFSRESSR